MTQVTQWICCQLGAREHYAVPRALHRQGRLGMMVTDAWTRPGSPLALVPGGLAQRLAERSHSDLASADVRDLTLSLVRQEIGWRIQRRTGWDLLMARNDWFQEGAVGILEEHPSPPTAPVVVFAHSYSALKILRYARTRGWTTVLGQIDPGQEHFAMVRRLAEASPQFGPAPPSPPRHYFEQWHEECALADHIIVNSDWSRQSVGAAGVVASQLHVLPLACEDTAGPAAVAHAYPERFTDERPLRLLFVGSVSVVKGAAELLEAMSLLAAAPVTLTLVGERGMAVPSAWERLSSVAFIGAVPRSDLSRYYAVSDALVFPSHSDGFGMAQIEARAAGLPIVASACCGRVVDDRVTGVILPEVSAPVIAAVIRELLQSPATLARYSHQSVATRAPGLADLGAALVRVVTA